MPFSLIEAYRVWEEICCLHSQTAGSLFGLIIDPDDGGSILFRNTSVYQTTRPHISESSASQSYNYYKKNIFRRIWFSSGFNQFVSCINSTYFVSGICRPYSQYSDYIASDVGIEVTGGFQRIWKEALADQSRYYLGIRLEWRKKI
jgi:hypothetical protein